jgi:hydrogenase maturation protease
MSARVLVAGVGNVFLGDDGFGVEVARRLAAEGLPGVEVEDFGIRGLHLAFRLLDPPALLVVADAVARGGPAGTLYVLEPDPPVDGDPAAGAAEATDGHGMHLPAVLAAARAMGAAPPRAVRIVGCEPADLGERMGLSAAVAAAVEPAVALVRSLAEEELGTTARDTVEEAVP